MNQTTRAFSNENKIVKIEYCVVMDVHTTLFKQTKAGFDAIESTISALAQIYSF